MKLNEQCMADILQMCANNILILESGATLTPYKVLELPDKLTQYSPADVLYSVIKLVELNYITLRSDQELWDEYTRVRDVTYHGHKYLESFLQQNPLT